MADELRTRGWIVHHIGDVFPEDAQLIADEEWIDHGLCRSWVPLSKDGRIKTRDSEIRPVRDHAAVFFYLDNQQLSSIRMVERLDTHRTAMHEAIEKGGPSAYAVRHDRIERTWP